MSYLLVGLGALFLYLGGEFLIRGAVRLATRFGVSSMVIGLSVVAFGTSAPELAATLTSAFQGVPDIAIGNIVGSNIANIGLILGLTAIVYPLIGSTSFLRRDVPVMVVITALLIPLMAGGMVGRLEGLLLLVLLLAYLLRLFRPRGGGLEDIDINPEGEVPLWRLVVVVVVGIVLLVVGARTLVAGAIAIAEGLGIPERVIGLTLVAFGTSLPELASSLVAALRRETDIILGNVVGSNIFNVLAVMGTTALVRPVRTSLAEAAVDLGVMVVFGLALLPLMWRRGRLGRRGGLLLFAGYVTYVVLLYS